MKGSVELRLLTEPDPVRVVDFGSKRLMTEKDVIALANVSAFAKSQGDPTHRQVSRQEIERMVAALNRTFGGNSGKMPRFLSETAAFWAGVRQNWNQLSADERNLARAYAAKTGQIRLPSAMFGKLWGLGPDAAFSRNAADVHTRLVMMTNIGIETSNLPLLMDNIFRP